MHLILDTDIGTDVDDALALGVLLGSPQIKLDLITTVYGDTRLRAQLASRFVNLAGGRSDLQIHAGMEQTRSGRQVWWPGHEGALHAGLDREVINDMPAVDAIADHVGLGGRTILAVGPLANIAEFLDRHPAGAADVDQIVIMGGDFSDERVAEHNFMCDITAAQRVAASEVPIVIGGLDLTTRIALRDDHVQAIGEGGPLGAALRAEIAQWWEFHGHEWNNPHDPILAAWLIAPQLFASERGRLDIDDTGRSWFTPDEVGAVTRLVDLDERAVADLIVERIQAATTARIDVPQ